MSWIALIVLCVFAYTNQDTWEDIKESVTEDDEEWIETY